jgi:hypothetical protein
MKSIPTCPACGCTHPSGAAAHAIVAALVDDDLDQTMTLGLLEHDACAACTPACVSRLRQARDARLRSLAARERYRARNVRLARRAAERDARRQETVRTTSSLPPAAAAVLARAKAKAAGKA